MNKSEDNPINTGEQVISWLYTEQLKVDAEWSIRTPAGFTWWADKNSQRIEVVGEMENEAGEKAYFVSVRTEFLYHLPLNAKTLAGINALLMAHASMSGPVYDHKTGTLWLCSLVRVHEGIRAWMSPLISMAAVLQIAEARIMGPGVAKLFGAQPAESKHPTTGWRTEPDELAELVATVVAPLGKQPCKWTAREFLQVVDQNMKHPPALRAKATASGLTVEFPFGKATSRLQLASDQPHPRYGNGLFLLQSFPVAKMTDESGTKLALEINAVEMDQNPSGYGFGSYCYHDKAIHFTSFLPNAAYRAGLCQASI